MVKKAFLVASLGVGCAVMAMVSIATQPRLDEAEVVAPASQVDANALTLKARNLPIQTLDDAI
jgi:hypothetical protein